MANAVVLNDDDLRAIKLMFVEGCSWESIARYGYGVSEGILARKVSNASCDVFFTQNGLVDL